MYEGIFFLKKFSRKHSNFVRKLRWSHSLVVVVVCMHWFWCWWWIHLKTITSIRIPCLTFLFHCVVCQFSSFYWILFEKRKKEKKEPRMWWIPNPTSDQMPDVRTIPMFVCLCCAAREKGRKRNTGADEMKKGKASE